MVQRYTPKQRNIVSSADEIGALLDLSRIEGESLYEYKKRLLSNSKYPSNSTYEGLTNALNRELGLKRNKPIEVTLRKIAVLPLSANVVILKDSIKDTRELSFTIDGEKVIAVGNTVTLANETLSPESLVGMSLFVQQNEFKILDNTNSKIKIDGDLSDLIGQQITIKSNRKTDAFVGLCIESDNNKFRIIRNTSNIIQVDSESLEKIKEGQLKVVVTNPRIQIDSCRILLYRDYINEENYQLDTEILLRDKGKNHLDIIDEINGSRFFKASNLGEIQDRYEAFTIKKQDSDFSVYSETIPATKYFQLKNKNIKEGSLRFDETGIFFSESREIEKNPYGAYYQANYKEGIIQSKMIPSGYGTVSYVYSKIPFQIETVEALVTPFSDKNAQLFLFNQRQKERYTDARNKQEPSQPKSDMVECISELLGNSKQTWGK